MTINTYVHRHRQRRIDSLFLEGCVSRFARCLVMALLIPAFAHAGTIAIGIFSFDNSFTGVNAFNVANFTGPSALPPDFPVIDGLTFTLVAITLDPDQPPPVPPLDDVPAGSSDSLAFPDTMAFLSATLSFTLNQTSFLLQDGTTFVADSATVQTLLLPSGSSLAPGDLAAIEVSGSVATSTPEPGSLGAVLIGLATLCALQWKRRARHSVSN